MDTPDTSDAPPLLRVRNLCVSFSADSTQPPAVRSLSFALRENETVAIVGESGSGKTVTALALTRLLPPSPHCRISGSIEWMGQDVTQFGRRDLRLLRGGDIAYIFQEPSSSLNPVFTVGAQIEEAIRLHRKEIAEPRKAAIQAMEEVGIRDPAKRYHSYPDEMSGGMLQRIMIATALACRPRLLVADEPTTALDVTIQKQILELIVRLKHTHRFSILLITHNMAILPDLADRILVMRNGELVESAPAQELLRQPRHAYTRALLACVPRIGHRTERLPTIEDFVAD